MLKETATAVVGPPAEVPDNAPPMPDAIATYIDNLDDQPKTDYAMAVWDVLAGLIKEDPDDGSKEYGLDVEVRKEIRDELEKLAGEAGVKLATAPGIEAPQVVKPAEMPAAVKAYIDGLDSVPRREYAAACYRFHAEISGDNPDGTTDASLAADVRNEITLAVAELVKAEKAADPTPAESPAKSGPSGPVTYGPSKAERLSQLAERIDQQKRTIGEATVELYQAKAEVKGLAKSLESELEQLEKLVEEQHDLDSSSAYQTTLFDECGKPAASTAPAAQPEQATSEAWRAVPIGDVLGALLTEKLRASLEKAQLLTLGEIADYTASSRRLTDLDGVGQATAEKIEDAIATWWTKHPEMMPSSTPAAQAATEAVEESPAAAGDEAVTEPVEAEADADTSGLEPEAKALVEKIDELLLQDKYQFAAETLSGIRETVLKQGRATRRQRDAVANIEDGAEKHED